MCNERRPAASIDSNPGSVGLATLPESSVSATYHNGIELNTANTNKSMMKAQTEIPLGMPGLIWVDAVLKEEPMSDDDGYQENTEWVLSNPPQRNAVLPVEVKQEGDVVSNGDTVHSSVQPLVTNSNPQGVQLRVINQQSKDLQPIQANKPGDKPNSAP